MPQVETVRPLEVNAPGSSELKISNRGSNSIFYGDNAQVSASEKTGTLAQGESLTIKGPLPVWLKAEAVPALIDFQQIMPGQAGGAGEYVPLSQKGIASGVAELDSLGNVQSANKGTKNIGFGSGEVYGKAVAAKLRENIAIGHEAMTLATGGDRNIAIGRVA